MKEETVYSDITVVGGGLAGVCAAVAAARLGSKVALINNRGVLGGNSSSEVRVWVCGATAHGTNRYARETGIMGELFLENQYQNPDGNPYLWDLVVLELVKAEPNIQLFLHTDVHEAEANGPEDDRLIKSVTGWMMGSERKIRFESPIYLDCTGDGLVGFLAGAKYRIGREARHEHDEEWAPEIADDITLGSTLLFYTKDAGHPVKFVPPSFAKDITKTLIPIKRVIRSGDSGCHYWWIEWGGELDTVHANEQIRDELWSVIYGIWDYIKNSGEFEADSMTLEWVGSLPGKREYRRFLGDYVLNQNDIIAQTPFEDRIAFGGWSIDLHPPQGMYAAESGSKHMHADGIYHIPYRSLYSANVRNMLFAGRNVSASHVAFGTTRVMATCAVMGEAAGTAAALCVRSSVTPRQLHAERLAELQQTLLKQDASIIGLPIADGLDIAQQATVTASSHFRHIAAVQTSGSTEYALVNDVGMLLPVDGGLDSVELLVDAIQDTELCVEVWDTGRMENYVPASKQLEARAALSKGEKQWVSLELGWLPELPQNAFLVILQNEAVKLHSVQQTIPGVLAFERKAAPNASKDLEDHDEGQPVIEWSMKHMAGRLFSFKANAETRAYAPAKAVDSIVRPYGGPHLWMSEEITELGEQWLRLDWERDQRIAELRLTWNADVNEDLINLHHHRTPFEVLPDVVKAYRIEAMLAGQWVTVASERNNRRRLNVLRLEQDVSTKALRVVIMETHGASFAQLVRVSVYS
ncbi:FAD-dependent oxidoreductase [Paenibacillus sp. 2TAB23]|uniref:FAD-dependent oxidoreductase n=1 Tax=Paenibacillus sp. 2TAB23 TaxID=3233004 RepID=UPI003F97B783